MARNKRNCFEVDFEFGHEFAEYDEHVKRTYPFTDLADALAKVMELKKEALSLWEEDDCEHFEITIWRYDDNGWLVTPNVFRMISGHGTVWE